jgi:hypothetical protein
LPDKIVDDEAKGKKIDFNFKSNTTREENAITLFNRRPISLNEGNYRVSYDPIDAKVPGPDIKDIPKHVPRSRLFHVAPCAIEKTDCNLPNRKKARLDNAQAFNSAI